MEGCWFEHGTKKLFDLGLNQAYIAEIPLN